MLRSEIIDTVKAVEKLLGDLEVEEALRTVTNDKGVTPDVLAAVLKYVVSLSSKFSALSETGKEIVAAVGFAELFNSEWWAQTMSGAARSAQNRALSPAGYMRRREAALSVLPGIVKMLEDGHDSVAQSDVGSKEESNVLQLVFPEARGVTSSRRITTGLLAIEELYEAVARLQNQPIDNLAISACDSGSNKVFDFKGLGPVVAELRLTVVEIWDRVHLRSERKASAQIDVVVKGLSAFAKINELREANKISTEQAALIERTLLSGTIKFVDAGVLTQDIADRAQPSPEALARPAEPLLLPSPHGTEPKKPKRSTRPKKSPPLEVEDSDDDDLR